MPHADDPLAAVTTHSQVVSPIDVQLVQDDVVGFLDYPAGREPPERIANLLRDTLVEARPLLEARGAYRMLEPNDSRDIGLGPIAADRLVIGLVTVGSALEQRVSELLQSGALTRAVLLDAAGSAAAEEAADRLAGLIGRAHQDPRGGTDDEPDRQPAHTAPTAVSSGARGASRVSCRLSPGYGRWTLRWQRALFARLPHRELGIELSDACLMSPRKSISFAMWLGARERIAQGLGGCENCTLSRCRYRRLSRPDGQAPLDATAARDHGPHQRGDGS